jgi:hypothetical protein
VCGEESAARREEEQTGTARRESDDEKAGLRRRVGPVSRGSCLFVNETRGPGVLLLLGIGWWIVGSLRAGKRRKVREN